MFYSLCQKRFKILFFITTFCCYGTLYSQTTEWFALSDCSTKFTTHALDVDDQGNCYVGGEFHGETKFNSAGDSTRSISAYLSGNIGTGFMAKYAADGRIEYLVQIQRSGSYSPRVQKIKTLSNGKIAVLASVSSSFRIIDAHQDTTHVRANKLSMVLYFDASGSYQGMTRLLIEYAFAIEEANDGTLYAIGQKRGYRVNDEQEVLRISPVSYEAKKVNVDLKGVQQMVYHDGKLWFLSNTTTRTQLYSKAIRYRLYSLGLTYADTLRTEFERQFGLSSYSFSDLAVCENEVHVGVLVRQQGTGGIELDQEKYEMDKEFNAFFLFDSKGNLKGGKPSILNNSIYPHNFEVIGLESGGVILQTAFREELKIDDHGPIPIEGVRSFRTEIMHVKYSSDMAFEWAMTGGGGGTNYRFRRCKAVGDDLFIVSDLFDFGYFDFGYRGLTWKTGGYLRKVKVPKSL